MARCTCTDDARMLLNLLALLPYTVRVRKVVDLPKPETPKPEPRPTALVFYRPSARRPGKFVGWI